VPRWAIFIVARRPASDFRAAGTGLWMYLIPRWKYSSWVLPTRADKFTSSWKL
jgi:hypothetical protein